MGPDAPGLADDCDAMLGAMPPILEAIRRSIISLGARRTTELLYHACARTSFNYPLKYRVTPTT